MRTDDNRPAVRPLATLLIALLLALGAFTATAATSTANESLVVEVTPEFAENDVGSNHTVTATVTYDGLPTIGILVSFSVISGPNLGLMQPPLPTDAIGQVSFTYLGIGGVGTDEIEACAVSQAGDQTCRAQIFKNWVLPNTPPDVACVESVNPHGAKIPPAGKTTLPGPKGGQNEDGFYQLLSQDAEDGTAPLFVTNASGSFTFGPFLSGSVVKITEDDEVVPTSKPMGGPNSAVTAHIILDSDAFVFAVDSFGEFSPIIACLVPKPPK